MTNENDFDMSGEKEYSLNSSNQEQSSSTKKNFDSSKLNGFANKFRQKAKNAVRTGNTKDLEDLLDDSLFYKAFSDKRNFFVKIKDASLSYLANLKNAEYLVKSGKYQAIESQIKDLYSNNNLINKYKSNQESAKSDMIRILDDYDFDISKQLDVIAKKESELINLKQTFTDDAVELFEKYFSGEISLNDLSNKDLNTDIESIQSYRHGIAKLHVLESELDRKQESLNALNTEYEILLDKKSGVEFDLISLDLQEFYNAALINQLSVDLKLSSRPSIISFFAGLRTIRDKAYSLSNSLIDLDIEQRKSYKSASERAGYDNSFRKQYAAKQKEKSNLKL